ncbi:hypothetical protein GCM10022281_19920 [Sphingomonas rosea]|uniref:Glycosyltransferase 2-like domain-containing protein n=1 Tax=Sphingomonas rosea TaxID=335605 RepID=A0ABP7UAN0_9SPHN
MSAEVSLLIITYQAEATVAAALHAALAQEGPPLDIVVSDDASRDETFAIAAAIADTYRGPHRVRCFRNPTNLGLIGNVLAGAARCEGGLILLAAGDDRSHPERARRLAEAWQAAGSPDAAVVYSDVRPIGEDGAPVAGWNEQVARPPWTLERLARGGTGPLGASCAITPRLLAAPEPIDTSIRHEDRVFPFRALLLGGQMLFVDAKLVDYQVTGGVSRQAAATPLEELTTLTSRFHRATLPDARARLRDAELAGASPAILRRCRQTLREQEALLALSSGEPAGRTLARAVAAGARPLPLLAYLARLAKAKLAR